MIWVAISWYSAGALITLNGQITASDYMDILGNQVHPMVQMFPNNDAVFQDDSSPIRTARLKYHRTTVISFREQGEKQIPSFIITQATRRCFS